MFGAWVRRTGFWLLDFLKGSKVKKNYKQIKKIMENGELNKSQLAVILDHAVNTTVFYKDCCPTNISTFPIVTKNDLKEKKDELYSFLYKNQPVHQMSTSGSTGTPLVMDWDSSKRKRQLAELIYFNEKADQKLGQPYIYFRVWNEKNRKSKKERWMQNLIPIDISHLDDNSLEKIRQRLKKRPYINSCVAYASTYEYLVRYLKSKGDTPEMFHTKTFITSSEVLSLEMKQMVKDVVGCSVIDRYSNQENGFLAQSGDCSDVFEVNTSGFYMEILKDDCDEPVEIGEVGRIVITDLYNKAMPVIRYDTGDLAIKYEEKDGWVTKIKTIQGRKADCVYDTKGNKMTSFTWGVYMWKFDKLKQYQFVQEGEKNYTLKVNGAKGVYADEEFIVLLKSVLGEDAEVKIEHVEGIPMLASGKFKRVVCNYQPKIDEK